MGLAADSCAPSQERRREILFEPLRGGARSAETVERVSALQLVRHNAGQRAGSPHQSLHLRPANRLEVARHLTCAQHDPQLTPRAPQPSRCLLHSDCRRWLTRAVTVFCRPASAERSSSTPGRSSSPSEICSEGGFRRAAIHGLNRARRAAGEHVCGRGFGEVSFGGVRRAPRRRSSRRTQPSPPPREGGVGWRPRSLFLTEVPITGSGSASAGAPPCRPGPTGEGNATK